MAKHASFIVAGMRLFKSNAPNKDMEHPKRLITLIEIVFKLLCMNRSKYSNKILLFKFK